MRNDDTNHGLSIMQNAVWNSVGSLTYAISNWLITVLVVILASDYSASGDLALCMAVGNIVATIVLFKTRPVQISDVKGRYSTAEYVGSKIVSSTIGVVFGFVYTIISVPRYSWLPVFSYIVFKLIESFVDVFHGVDQKHDRLDYVGISQIIRGVVIVVMFIGGICLTDSLTFSINLMTISSFVCVCIYDLPRSSRLEILVPQLRIAPIVSLMKRCAPGFVASLLATFVVSFSRQTLGNQFGSDALGIFAALSTPAVIVQALAGYLYAPLLVPIARAWSKGEIGPIIRLIVRFVLVLIAIICGAIVSFQALGSSFFSLIYGSEVARCSNLMPLILVSTGVTAAMLFALDILIILNGYYAACAVSFISFLTCILLASRLVAWASMNGVSLTITVAYSVGLFFASIIISIMLRQKRSARCLGAN